MLTPGMLARPRFCVRYNRAVRPSSEASSGPHWALLSALALIALAALPGVLRAGVPAAPVAIDQRFQLQQFALALSELHVLPAWLPDSAFGLGLPLPPAALSPLKYLAALLSLLGFSTTTAWALSAAGAMLLGGAGVFGWLRASGRSPASAWLAAVAYAVSPLLLAETTAPASGLGLLSLMALLPATPWALRRLRNQPHGATLAWLGLTLGLLLFNGSTAVVVFAVAAGLYALTLLLAQPAGDAQGNTAPAGRYAGLALAAMLLAAALAAPGWLPALSERAALAGPAPDMTLPVVQWRLVHDYGAQASTIGLWLALLALPGLVGATLKRDHHAQVLLAGAGLALAVALLAPLRALVDAPVALLVPLNLALAALIGEVWQLAPATLGSVASWGLNVLAALTLLAAALLGMAVPTVLLADADLGADRLHTREYIAGITTGALPVWVSAPPTTSSLFIDGTPEVLVVGGQASGERVLARNQRQDWQLSAGPNGATVALPLHYWPGWRATLNGSAVATSALQGLGWLTVEVPPGEHTLQLQLRPTPARWLALALMGIAIAALVLLWQPWRPGRWPWRSLAAGALAAVALVIVGQVQGAQVVPAVGLSMDADALAVLNRATLAFANGSQLRDYRYSSVRLTGGDTLTIETNWAGATGDYRMRLLSPQGWVLAEASGESGPASVLTLPLPENSPAGVYLVALDAGDPARARLLVPVAIRAAATGVDTGALTPLTPALALANLTTAQVDDTLLVSPTWLLSDPLGANLDLTLSLRDPTGALVAARRVSAGGGGQPTTLWPVNLPVPDRYTLALPAEAQPGDHTLTLALSNPASGALVAQHTQVVGLAAVTGPDAAVWQAAGGVFDTLRLAAYRAALAGNTLELSLAFSASGPTTGNLDLHVQLVDPASGAVVASVAGAPESGPSTGFTAGQVIVETVRLPLDAPGSTAPGTTLNVQVTWLNPLNGAAVGPPAVLGTGVLLP